MTTKFQDAKRVAAIVCSIGVVAIATGCATTGVTPEQLDEVRSIAQSAENAANEARRLASDAQNTANQALSAAQDAQACCDATNQRLDRMFEQSQAK